MKASVMPRSTFSTTKSINKTVSFLNPNLDSQVQKSKCLNMIQRLSSFVILTSSLENEVNYNWEYERTIDHFIGTIITFEVFSLLVLSAEIYLRDSYEYTRLEKSGDSFLEEMDNTMR
jgi:hypothetical protein